MLIAQCKSKDMFCPVLLLLFVTLRKKGTIQLSLQKLCNTWKHLGGKLSVATLIKMLFYHTFILDIAHGHIAASIIF